MSESSTSPYIGVPISIISKADIRYEGVLYAINPTEHTVSLTQVRSLGTEDRKPQNQFIPSSDEFYEFIIFKGSEIKDLHVISAPSAPQQSVVSSNPPLYPQPSIHNNTSKVQEVSPESHKPKLNDSDINHLKQDTQENHERKYDKKTSFFDSLTNGEESKFDRHAINKRDSETFGERNVRSAQSALRMYLNRGRRGRNRGKFRGRAT